MTCKRAVSPELFDYRVFKKGRFFEKRVNKRRHSQACVVSNKRLCPDIYLTVTDIIEPIPEIGPLYISSANLMAYTFSGDPRDRAATDIQRVFKGWVQRRRGLVLQFNSISLL